MDIIKYNSTAWNKASETALEEWTKPVSSDIIENARNGVSEVLLTTAKFVPEEWYVPIKGKKCCALPVVAGNKHQCFQQWEPMSLLLILAKIN